MNCLRCDTPMNFLGSRSFHEGTRWGILGDLGELMVNKERFDIFACPQCGKTEFFLSGTASRNWTLSDLPFEIELNSSNTTTILSQTQLLKLVPGKSKLDDVYETIGHPIAAHVFESGAALCYPSEDNNNPHVVLINIRNQTVRLVAIYNSWDDFTLENLEEAYGERELAGSIDGYEHWLFEENGVSFIAEGRNENQILYVQFLEPGITLDAYLTMKGFSQEVFACMS